MVKRKTRKATKTNKALKDFYASGDHHMAQGIEQGSYYMLLLLLVACVIALLVYLVAREFGLL